MKKLSIIVFLLISFCIVVFALTEEEIFVPEANMLLKYSLSNDLKEIENAIKVRTGINVDLSEVGWELSPSLSQSVKDLMKKHNANYAMTTYVDGYFRAVSITRRFGEQWFNFSFEDI